MVNIIFQVSFFETITWKSVKFSSTVLNKNKFLSFASCKIALNKIGIESSSLWLLPSSSKITLHILLKWILSSSAANCVWNQKFVLVSIGTV